MTVRKLMAGACAAMLLLQGTGAAAAGLQVFPDWVLYNGKVSTVDARDTVVEALAIRNGEIVGRGSSKAMRALAGPATRSLDLAGRRVLPGLIDGHLHGLRQSYHCFTRSVRLDATYRRSEALARYRAKDAALQKDTWIVTHGGWTPEQFVDDGRMFTKAELDSAVQNHPAYVRFLTYDGVLVNQRALDLLNLPADTPGLVMENGRPTGQLKQPPAGTKDVDAWAFSIAGRAIEAQLNAMTIDDQAGCLADFIAEENSLGLTAWVDPDGNQQPFNMVDGGCRSFAQGTFGREAADELRRRRQLNARIAFYVTPRLFRGYDTIKDDPRLELSGLGDDDLRLIGVGEELFCPGNRAQPPEARYQDTVNLLAAYRANFKNHASGIEAQRAYLDAWEKADKVYPLSKLHWTMGHPAEDGVLPPESLERMKRLGVGMDTSTVASLGVRPAPPFQRIYESGVRWCLSTDSTAGSSYAPFSRLWFAVSGDTLKPGVKGVPADQTLTRAQALRASTANCAWHMMQEGRLGSLEVGKHADLVVLDRDYFTVPVADIKALRAVLTMVGGRIVYQDTKALAASMPTSARKPL